MRVIYEVSCSSQTSNTSAGSLLSLPCLELARELAPLEQVRHHTLGTHLLPINQWRLVQRYQHVRLLPLPRSLALHSFSYLDYLDLGMAFDAFVPITARMDRRRWHLAGHWFSDRVSYFQKRHMRIDKQSEKSSKRAIRIIRNSHMVMMMHDLSVVLSQIHGTVRTSDVDTKMPAYYQYRMGSYDNVSLVSAKSEETEPSTNLEMLWVQQYVTIYHLLTRSLQCYIVAVYHGFRRSCLALTLCSFFDS